jgi:clan AA aspartic protease (TIGR02281 family)
MIGIVVLLLGLAGGLADAATRHATPPAAPAAPAPGTTEIPVQDNNGTVLVPVTINDAVKLSFTLDSGASVVSIPADVAMTLMRTGTLTREDFLGNATFQLADGRTVPSTILRIRSLKVGDIEIQNVEASVSDVKGDLLLGQTFLARFSSWSIDNQRHVLVLGPLRPGPPPTLALTQPRRTRHPRADHDTAPSDDTANTAAAGRPETDKGVEWDAAYLQACVPDAAKTGLSSRAAQSYCKCVVTALQPLPLTRKKRLVPHSHEVLAADAACTH